MGQVLGYLYESENPAVREGPYATRRIWNDWGPPLLGMCDQYELRDVVVVSNETECNAAVRRLNAKCNGSLFRVLGMDCEWYPDFSPNDKNPVALLQLATLDGYCALFRLSHMDMIPWSLQQLLEDRNILKVGVAIENDVKRLNTRVHGWADLRHLEELIRHYPNRYVSQVPHNQDMKLGLSSLASRIFGIKLDKDSSVRFGNWDTRGQLDHEQIKYAALDAFVAVCICHEVTRQKLPGYHGTPMSIVANISERPYKFKSRAASGSQGGVKNQRSSSRKSYLRLLPKRQTPMYDNIFLLAPDGEVLCTCDRRRAMWYVDKGIGELIEEKADDHDDLDGECKTIIKVRLKFEPKRRAINESEKYYCIVKDNRCVVCGKEDSYLRKHIVPHEYRKYFPVWMKSRQSHDVLLLCIDCHVQSNRIDLKLRQKLAKDCEAPLTVAKAIEVKDAPAIRRLQSAAKALSRKPEAIPPVRRKELEEIVLNYFSSQERESRPSEVTPELLSSALEVTYSVVNECYTPHGLKVVEHFRKLGEEEGIRALEIMWRKHFVEEMRPRFLPDMWSTHHFRMSPEGKELESKMLKEEQELLKATSDLVLS